MITQIELKAEEIRQLVQDLAKEHLPLETSGYQISSEMLRDILLKAAINQIGFNASCKELTGAVGENKMQKFINEQLTVEEPAPIRKQG